MITAIASEEETYQRCKALLTGPTPGFLARIGGSDTDALVSRWRYPDDAERLGYFIDRVQAFNGFYEFGGDLQQSYLRYLETLAASYRSANEFMTVTTPILTLYYPQRLGPQYLHRDQQELDDYRRFIPALFEGQGEVFFHPYDFVERLLTSRFTFFRLLSEILPAKRVLVISPFGPSIRQQQANKDRLFKDFEYPNFELLTYEVPVTYSGLSREMYPDQSWHETLERMKQEISGIDFDIALLSCGSYAMPLGLHIRDYCKKHAAYVGGCLQLFFGIMGRRWGDLPFFTNQLYAENFISPSEGMKYKKHVEVNDSTQREAFGAYF